MSIVNTLKFLYSIKNGDCNHEKLWKTESGFCYVCKDEIPRERLLRISLLLLKKLKQDTK